MNALNMALLSLHEKLNYAAVKLGRLIPACRYNSVSMHAATRVRPPHPHMPLQGCIHLIPACRYKGASASSLLAATRVHPPNPCLQLPLQGCVPLIPACRYKGASASSLLAATRVHPACCEVGGIWREWPNHGWLPNKIPIIITVAH